ncbi:hypothetical protein [Methylobacterium soli]|uniref:Uncharacterized protein n=1 Tax=Methylobacterium soli TaxID=553447 RepID=A0A6L3ST01_9HYPH|nr:hypothetical protein [Methylobacterium soli]KAB1071113.1 hypothetical protein F6X53_29290 [Methylobacterium soli]
METASTTADLLKHGLIADTEVDAAVETFMSDPKATLFVLGNVYRLNPHAAVKAYAFARNNLRNPEASPGLKRAAVRKAILLARPERR